MTLQDTTELEQAIKLRLEAMYLSAMPVNNLDTGEQDPPVDMQVALGYHLPAVMQLVFQEANDTAIKELEETRSFGNPHDYIETRLSTLKAEREKL